MWTNTELCKLCKHGRCVFVQHLPFSFDPKLKDTVWIKTIENMIFSQYTMLLLFQKKILLIYFLKKAWKFSPLGKRNRESERPPLFRYKFCGSLPNHLDDKDALDDDPKENNNVMTDTISGNLGGTLPHKKRSLGVHFSDGGPTGTLDLVKHRSQDSLDENDPWRYAIGHPSRHSHKRVRGWTKY